MAFVAFPLPRFGRPLVAIERAAEAPTQMIVLVYLGSNGAWARLIFDEGIATPPRRLTRCVPLSRLLVNAWVAW
jgi:hypothetical protein